MHNKNHVKFGLTSALTTLLLGCSQWDSDSGSDSTAKAPEPSIFETVVKTEGQSMFIGPATAQQPHIIASAEGVKVLNLISNGYLPTDYVLPNDIMDKTMLPIFESHVSSDASDTDGRYVLSGEPDGLGALDNGDGTFTLYMNQEHYNFVGGEGVQLESTNRSLKATGTFISKWTIDSKTGDVLGGEDLIKSVNLWRRNAKDSQGNITIAGGYENVTSLKSYHDDDGDLLYQGSFERFCSATLPEQSALYNEKTGKGSKVRMFFTGEEIDGKESLIDYYNGVVAKRGYEGKAFAPDGSVIGDATTDPVDVYDGGSADNIYIGRAFVALLDGDNEGMAYELPLLGRMKYENIVPNNFEQDKTVLVSTDDATYRSKSKDAYRNGGFVTVYVGEKQAEGNEIEKAGLTNGELYAIQVNQLIDDVETPVVDFHDDDNIALLNDGRELSFKLINISSDDVDIRDMSQPQFRAHVTSNQVAQWKSPEDGDWDPSNPNIFYFGDKHGVYQLTFTDIADPTLGGTVKRIVDSYKDGRLAENYENFDNMAAVKGVDGKTRLVIQFDKSSVYSPIYVLDVSSGVMTKVAQYDPQVIGSMEDEFPEFLADQIAAGDLVELPEEGSQAYTDAMIEFASQFPYRKYFAESGGVKDMKETYGVELPAGTDGEASGIIYAGDILGEGWFLTSSQFHFDMEGRVDSLLMSFDVRDLPNGASTQLIQEMMALGQLHAIYIPQAVGLK